MEDTERRQLDYGVKWRCFEQSSEDCGSALQCVAVALWCKLKVLLAVLGVQGDMARLAP